MGGVGWGGVVWCGVVWCGVYMVHMHMLYVLQPRTPIQPSRKDSTNGFGRSDAAHSPLWRKLKTSFMVCGCGRQQRKSQKGN